MSHYNSAFFLRPHYQLEAATVNRIPVHTPEWSNPQKHDPGVTVIGYFNGVDGLSVEQKVVEDSEVSDWMF